MGSGMTICPIRFPRAPHRKAKSQPSLGIVPHRGLAGRAFLKLVKRQRVNVTCANIPCPDVSLYLAGAQLLEVFPMVPLMGTVALGVGAMSYAGQFTIMAVADRDACTDVDIFAAGIRDELRALTATDARHADVVTGLGHGSREPTNSCRVTGDLRLTRRFAHPAPGRSHAECRQPLAQT
jgi:hypothetical protein